MTLLAVATIMALVALTGSVLYAARVFSLPVTISEPVIPPDGLTAELANLVIRLERTEQDFEVLKLAVSDGIMRVDRADKRIQKTVTSARRLIRENGLEHAGLEAEYDELQQRDDEPSPVSEVLPLFQEVAPLARTGIPGVNPQELARIKELMNA